MNLPPSKSRRLPNPPSSPATLPDELIIEILSFLPVKSLIQIKCVCKFFNSLISDPIFIKLHLQKSSRNPHLALVTGKCIADFRYLTVPLTHLLQNLPIQIPEIPSYPWSISNHCWLVGSCNGILCFAYYVTHKPYYRCSWLCFYNPATKVVSKKLGYCDYKNCYCFVRYTFGYDNSTDTYKVVALILIGDRDGKTKLRMEVKVFNLGDDVWRSIDDFCVGPIRLTFPSESHGVYLNGSLNWLMLKDCFSAVRFYDRSGINVDQFVIISLDLRTETHVQLLPPRGFDEVPRVEPVICVLMDSLCFCHDFKKNYFVIWKMKEFGVEESWTRFLKISYQNLKPSVLWLPLHLSRTNNTIILANKIDNQAIIYNWRDKRVERITSKAWWFFSKNHVESLVSVC